jgi:hypothetical protein
MVASQIAMAVVMLVAALLFVGSFRNLMTVDTGMRHEGISLAAIRFPESIARDRFDDYRRELLAEIQSVPGVVNAERRRTRLSSAAAGGHGIRVGEISNSANFTWVSPGYFSTMAIPIVRGRDFNLRDTRSSPRVAIVNETFVKLLPAAEMRSARRCGRVRSPTIHRPRTKLSGSSRYAVQRSPRRERTHGVRAGHPASIAGPAAF